jgi:hypothetical protein
MCATQSAVALRVRRRAAILQAAKRARRPGWVLVGRPDKGENTRDPKCLARSACRQENREECMLRGVHLIFRKFQIESDAITKFGLCCHFFFGPGGEDLA